MIAAGYHHVARSGEETGYLPKLLIEDVAAFDASRWSKNMRRDLRKCGQAAQVQQTDDPTLLLAQGYEVWQDASRRSGQLIPRGRGEFERLIRARWHEGPQIAVIGVQGNTLGGFLLAHVIGTRCYFDQVVLSSATAKWPLGVGLYERAIHEARQRGAQVVDLGLWDPALPNLDRFKARVGGTLVPTPAYARLAPGLAPWLQRRNPVKYARLLGTPTPYLRPGPTDA